MFSVFSTTDWAVQAPPLGASLLIGYLLGSIPFGLLFSWMAGAGDVRKIGSGNIGATNVLRTGKRWAALATLVFDGGKGAVAVLLTANLFGALAAACAAFGSFVGHVFPVWLRFRGGKGVATFFGVLLALKWPVGLLALATWLAVAGVFRISSLSALTAAALAPIYMMLFGQPLYAMLALLLTIFIFATHRENIRRLLAGREPRIGARA
jgi:glycerol-3-phosphate acyltransferase PlsY